MKYFFKACYDYWMAFAHILGVVNGYIIFTVFFIAVIGPYALIMKVFGHSASTGWQKKEPAQDSIVSLTNQF